MTTDTEQRSLLATLDRLAGWLRNPANADGCEPLAMSFAEWCQAVVSARAALTQPAQPAAPSLWEQVHAAQPAEGGEAVPREWRSALQKLAFMARTSGGTAGPDIGLMQACSDAEALLSKPYRYTAPPASQEQAQQPSEPNCDRSACGDFSPGPCDHPDCHALRKQQPSGGEVDDTIARLMQFYDADSLQSLALAQCKHVERLQAKLPRIDMPAFTRVREG